MCVKQLKIALGSGFGDNGLAGKVEKIGVKLDLSIV